MAARFLGPNEGESDMNTSTRVLLAGASIVVAAGLAACDKAGPAESAGKSVDQAAKTGGDRMGDASRQMGKQSDKAGVVLDDSAITGKVKAAILAEPGLDVLQIHVDTVSGVTTLTGSVDSQEHSDKAGVIAAAVNGVTALKNQLVVKSTQ
jgi:osmotically-inducible protein OsmY